MFNKKVLLILILTVFLLPNIHSAKLSNFDILIDIRGPEKAFLTETWVVEYNPKIANDKELFKEKILQANIDLDKFIKIDPNLKPNIYLKNYSKVSIVFDETKDIITINYEVSDLILQNYYETDEYILWKFNVNILKSLVVNNLYVIPSFSKLIIQAYTPLIIDNTTPVGEINRNVVVFNSLSSNELKVLIYEKKPPKPSFVLIGSTNSNIFYYLIVLFIILFAIILIFKEPINKSIKGFVIKHSIIKPKKQKKNFVVDSEFFEE